jgi:pimeloyl-ACP methyl ester carboxylesterase
MPKPEQPLARTFECHNGGRRLVGSDAGDGPALIFCHGLPGSVGTWGDLTARLARDHRVVVYDRFGYGASGKLTKGGLISLEAHAADLLAIMDHLALNQPVLIGWSFGGAIVQRLAEIEPARVDKLVLLASLGPAYSPPPIGALERLAGHPLGAFLIDGLLSLRPVRHMLVRQGLQEAFAPQFTPEEAVDAFAKIYASPRTVRAMVAENRAIDQMGLDRLKLRHKTLVLHGCGDLMVPEDVGRALADSSDDVEAFFIADHGHAVHISASSVIEQRIRAFVGSAQANRGRA